MKRYENLGMPIEVQIKDEFYVVAFINLIDREKSEYKCDLHVRDKESGFMMEIDRPLTLTSNFKKIKFDVTVKLSELIDNGYFDDDVKSLDNLISCMNALLDLQKKL